LVEDFATVTSARDDICCAHKRDPLCLTAKPIELI
jgi:hypothetical protein